MKETKPITKTDSFVITIEKSYQDVPKGHQPHKSGAGKHGKRKKPREKRVKDESE